MSLNTETTLALESFARVLCSEIGAGRALGVLEVADDTGVSDETIRNYCRGATVPDMRWAMAFTLCYGRRFRGLVERAWNAFFDRSGFRLVPAATDDVSFLDANGDGRLDGKDSRLHEARAVALGGQYLHTSEVADSDGIRTREEADTLAGIRNDQMRHLDAARACDGAVTPTRPEGSR